jgi:hypothetical protein
VHLVFVLDVRVCNALLCAILCSLQSAAAVAAAAAAAAAEAESGAKAAQAKQLNGHLHGSMQHSQPFGVSSTADAVTAAAQVSK